MKACLCESKLGVSGTVLHMDQASLALTRDCVHPGMYGSQPFDGDGLRGIPILLNPPSCLPSSGLRFTREEGVRLLVTQALGKKETSNQKGLQGEQQQSPRRRVC